MAPAASAGGGRERVAARPANIAMKSELSIRREYNRQHDKYNRQNAVLVVNSDPLTDGYPARGPAG